MKYKQAPEHHWSTAMHFLCGGRFALLFLFLMSSLLDCEIPKTVFESTIHSLAVSHTWPSVWGGRLGSGILLNEFSL